MSAWLSYIVSIWMNFSKRKRYMYCKANRHIEVRKFGVNSFAKQDMYSGKLYEEKPLPTESALMMGQGNQAHAWILRPCPILQYHIAFQKKIILLY